MNLEANQIRYIRKRKLTAEILWKKIAKAAPWPVYLASMLVFFLCLATFAELAHRQGIARAERRAAELAFGIRSSVEIISGQVDAAMDMLSRDGAADAACSPAQTALLHSIPPNYLYISAAARMDPLSGRIMCSTFGSLIDGKSLENLGYRIKDSRRINRRIVISDRGVEYFAITSGEYAVFIHSGVASTILSTLYDASLGAYIRQGGPVIFNRGPFDIQALRAMEGSGKSGVYINGLLQGMSVSQSTEYVAYVVFPKERVLTSIKESSALLLPIGVLLGLALSTIVFLLLRRSASISASLSRALGTSRVYMEYQPIVSLGTGRCIGAEALVRWKQRGHNIRPDHFIAEAERDGLMPLVTHRIVSMVAVDMTEALRIHDDFHVSINFSTLDLQAEYASEILSDLLKVTGLPPKSFWIEMTETGLAEEAVNSMIKKIRAMGIYVAVDDFGTGYANLRVLNYIKVDPLKIDKKFVDFIPENGQGSEVIDAIIALGKSLGLQIVAEGVENEYQAVYLRKKNVDYAQGWFFGRPLSKESLTKLMHEQGDSPANH